MFETKFVYTSQVVVVMISIRYSSTNKKLTTMNNSRRIYSAFRKVEALNKHKFPRLELV